jgi:hypothetical protein
MTLAQILVALLVSASLWCLVLVVLHETVDGAKGLAMWAFLPFALAAAVMALFVAQRATQGSGDRVS